MNNLFTSGDLSTNNILKFYFYKLAALVQVGHIATAARVKELSASIAVEESPTAKLELAFVQVS